MAQGIIARKIGMTQIFGPSGDRVPTTILAAGPCTVVQVKTEEADGYDAVVLGFEEALPYPDDPELQRKPSRKRLSKPQTGLFKKLEMAPKRVLREVRLSKSEVGRHNVGDEIKADIFKPGDRVDATAISKGRGFAGVMKLWNMKGAKQQGHGTHETKRHAGSIGQHTFPARVFPGRHMPRQMGNKRVTIQNLQVVNASGRRNILYVRGGVPGPRSGLVLIRSARKQGS